MTVTAMLTVAPLDSPEVDFDAEIANAIDALEEFDVHYETHPMETTIEADDLDTLFEAVKAAHRAVGAKRVGTTLRIDDFGDECIEAGEKVERVETHLGRPAVSTQ